MTDFKAKIHKIRFRLGLYSAPQTPLLDLDSASRQGEGLGCGIGGGEGREGEVEGREREGPKLLLNQGPSETCYVTESLLKYRCCQDSIN